ncbi:MAG: VIT domain-containing protein [bacterium]
MKRLFFLIPFLCFADGVIIPIPPSPDVKPVPLSLDYHNVSVKIKDQVASTIVDQAFINPYRQDIEGTYIFPLPQDASISSFSLFQDGKKISGEVLDKERAKKIYEDIVRRMKDPGLLEYIGGNLFKARVYPIPANGKKKIEISYNEILKSEEGVCKYIYPLDIEKLSEKPIKEIFINIEISESIPIKSIYSPTHNIKVERKDDYNARITYEESNKKPSSDFILYYTLDSKDIGLSLLTHKEDEDGFFLLLSSPNQKKEQSIPKDITFVIDTSGSMAGNKIEQAKSALIFCINSLNQDDRFNIIRFSSDIEPLFKEINGATGENREYARKFIKNLKASGGTNINDALISAFTKEEKRPHIILFLTDGIPTVGETDIQKITRNVVENNKKSKVFVFGVGDNVNTNLLDIVSSENNGISTYIREKENIEEPISSLYKKIENPVLSDISLSFGEVSVYDLYPKKIGDLFFGSQIILLGRYKDYGKTSLVLSGMMKEKRVYEYNVNFPKKEKGNEFIPHLWATRKIGYLLDQIRLKGENQEIIDEIKELSKKYGIITPYTSFLVVEEEEKVIQERFNALSKEDVGKHAIRMAEEMFALKGETIAKPSSYDVKHIKGRTYILKDGKWQDIEYKDKKTKKIKYESDEYFSLLNEETGKIFSLGKRIIFKYKENWYEVVE